VHFASTTAVAMISVGNFKSRIRKCRDSMSSIPQSVAVMIDNNKKESVFFPHQQMTQVDEHIHRKETNIICYEWLSC
jgi:hypothetical protein